MRVRPGRSQSGCRASRQHAAEHAFQPGLRQFNAVRCRQCRNAGPESRLPRDHLRRHHHPIDAAVGRMEMLLGWGHRIPRRVGRRQESFHLHRQRLSNRASYPRMCPPNCWICTGSTAACRELSPIGRTFMMMQACRRSSYFSVVLFRCLSFLRCKRSLDYIFCVAQVFAAGLRPRLSRVTGEPEPSPNS